MSNKPLPVNKDAETAVISGLFQSPEKIHLVGDILTSDSFYSPSLQSIFQAMTKLNENGEQIDPLTVKVELSKQGIEIQVYKLQQIASRWPTAEIIDRHAEIVQERYLRRCAINVLQESMKEAWDNHKDIKDIVASVQGALDKKVPIHRHRVNASVYPEIMDICDGLLNIKHGAEPNYITTGFADLDNFVNLTNGTLTVLGADPREGKSSFVICMLRHLAEINKRPILWTLEMTRQRVMQNIIGQEAAVDHQKMIQGRLSESEEKRLTDTAPKWANPKMGLLDGPWSIAEIRHRAIEEKRDNGLDLILIDALGDVVPPHNVDKDKTHKVYDEICRQLVNLAKEINVPALLTHHLNRSKAHRTDKRPVLTDLREAGERNADNVIFIHREALREETPENKHLAEFLIAKNRDGPTGVVTLGFDGPTKTFYNIDTRHNEPGPQEQMWREVAGEDKRVVLGGGIQ